MRRPFAVARLVALLGALLGGCSLIPEYERPGLPVSAAYPVGPAFGAPDRPDASELGWRDFFVDPVVQDLVGLTLRNNRDLRVAAENVLSAQATYRAQRASLFPTVDATAGAEFERLPAGATGTSVPLHVNSYSLGLSTTSYEIDLFGSLRSTSRQDLEQAFSQAETRESTQISLVAQVASEYLAWLADRESLDVSQQTAKAQQQSYDLTSRTLQGGTGTGLTVAQAESTLRNAQASVEQYARQVAQDMDEIVLLVGAPLPPDLLAGMGRERGLAAESVFPALRAGVPSDLLQRRPDIRAAEHTLLAANANIGAARAAFFPSISLTANGGTGSGSLGGLFGAGAASFLIQPQINVPIFDAGKNQANLDYAKSQKRIQVADYEKAIQTAFHDVADALAARSTYTRQVDAETKLVRADQRYYDLSKMRFDSGVDNYLNVLVAQNSLFSAQLTLVNLRLTERQNLVTLFKALGGGWSERNVAGRS